MTKIANIEAAKNSVVRMRQMANEADNTMDRDMFNEAARKLEAKLVDAGVAL